MPPCSPSTPDRLDMPYAGVCFSFKFASGKNWSSFLECRLKFESCLDKNLVSLIEYVILYEYHSEIKPDFFFFWLCSFSKDVTVKISHLLIESYSVENLTSLIGRAISYECPSVIGLILLFKPYLACKFCAIIIGTLVAIASFVPDFCKQDLCQIKLSVLASFVL